MGYPWWREEGVAIGVDAQGYAALAEDLLEQAEVSDGVFVVSEQGEGLAGGVIDGGEESEGRLVWSEPLTGAAVDLEHHTGLRFALAAAAVLGGTSFAG
jgi:hypothetical protein